MNLNAFSNNVRRLKRLEEVKENTVFDGLYIPYGNRVTVDILYNSNTNEILQVETSSEDFSLLTTDPGFVHQVLFDSISKYKNTRSESKLVLRFHFIHCSNSLTPELPEGNMPFEEYFYLYMVAVHDSEDMSDVTYLPLSDWYNVSIINKGAVIILNAQDVSIQELYLKTIGEELLNSISKNNPFKKAARTKGPGNGTLYIPRKWNMLQRPEKYWVYI